MQPETKMGNSRLQYGPYLAKQMCVANSVGNFSAIL